MSELSRLLAGKVRGFHFFFRTGRTQVTAMALGWSIDQLLEHAGIVGDTDRVVVGGGP